MGRGNEQTGTTRNQESGHIKQTKNILLKQIEIEVIGDFFVAYKMSKLLNF